MAQFDTMIQTSNDSRLLINNMVGERVIYANEEMIGNNRTLFVLSISNNPNQRLLGSFTFYIYEWRIFEFVRTNQIALGVFNTDPIPNEIEFQNFFGTPFQDFILNSENTVLRTAVQIYNDLLI
jgi:hypothetical protein